MGRSRGGNTTKIHTLVDALGYPVKIELSAGQVSDHIFAPKLLEGLKLQIVMADGGYDSVKFREQYKKRHLVECFFQKLKRFRRIATRFDKLSCRFLAFIHLACILIWLK